MTPHAQADRLPLAVQWCYWGFAFDDAWCDSAPWNTRPAEFAELAGRVVRMLECPDYEPPHPRAYTGPLRDVCVRLGEIGTPTQHRRWVLAQRAWLTGVMWQIGNQARSVMPSLDDYLAMRINSAAGEPVTSMIELVNGEEIPADELDAPPVRACSEMARMLASLDNDLHSYAKDRRCREADQNIVNVIVNERGCGPQDAVVAAMAVRDRIMCRFLELRDVAARRRSAATEQYLHDLGHVVRGNLDWGLSTPRYHVEGEVTAQPRWADRPSDAKPEPPAPSVAWWWDPQLAGGR